jgi:hypothetical protein
MILSFTAGWIDHNREAPLGGTTNNNPTNTNNNIGFRSCPQLNPAAAAARPAESHTRSTIIGEL